MAQPPILTLESAALAEGGSGLSMEVYPGDRYAVMGMAASGKTRFLDILEGIARPSGGVRRSSAKVVAAGNGGYNRRATPQTIARDSAKRGEGSRSAQVLTSLGLWEARLTPFPQLTPGQMVACDLLPCFMQDPDVILIDGHLDVIDPWTMEGVYAMLDEEPRKRIAAAVSTCQPSVARRLGSIIVLKDCSPKFVGTIQEAVASARPTELVVQTDDKSAVRTMAEPFTVSVKDTAGGLILTSHEGQALAARLLTQGYGRVKSVILREPTLEDALLAIH